MVVLHTSYLHLTPRQQTEGNGRECVGKTYLAACPVHPSCHAPTRASVCCSCRQLLQPHRSPAAAALDLLQQHCGNVPPQHQHPQRCSAAAAAGRCEACVLAVAAVDAGWCWEGVTALVQQQEPGPGALHTAAAAAAVAAAAGDLGGGGCADVLQDRVMCLTVRVVLASRC